MMDLEVSIANLSETPLHPPRRRVWDLLPTVFIGWLRKKFSFPKPTPREDWAVRSMFLRILFDSLSQTAAIGPETSDTPEDYEPDGGWN